MNTRSAVAVVVLTFGLVACERAATPAPDVAASPASTLEGVWRLAEVTVTGGNTSTITDPASVYMFGKTHYSMMRVTGATPRATFKAVDPSNEEKIAAYNTFNANAGTYELAGSTLTVRPIVSKHPNFMGGGMDTWEVRSSADTLWLTGKSSNFRFRMADGLASPSGPVDETVLKLVRVE